MLYAFGFQQLCIAVSDLYFLDPDAHHGAEQGVRLEIRLLERGASQSIFASAPIVLGRPIWRADLLEAVTDPGSFNRAHHHTRFDGWEPADREYTAALSDDPVGWVGRRLSQLDRLLDDLGLSDDDPARLEVDDVRAAVPEITHAIRQVVEGIRSGKLARPPDVLTAGAMRVGWL